MATRDESSSYTGLVVRPAAATHRAALEQLASLQHVRNIAQWSELRLSSERPLAGEDEDQIPGPYVYPVYILIGNQLVAILSVARKVVEHVCSEQITGALGRLDRVAIDIDGVVNDIIAGEPLVIKRGDKSDEIRYSLTFIHARTTEFQSSLRAVSFWGEHLASSSLLLANRDLFNCMRCGIRLPRTGELLRIGGDGSIAIPKPKERWWRQRLIEIRHALGYVNGRDHITVADSVGAVPDFGGDDGRPDE